ncbi:dynamin-like GTPase family protein [Picosynechococcus sp. PCC 73109]|uniref:dynamin-like GTPase family protein n=1 Tax=Picosynechococcus sp. PCC 73109 TaxID=374982 RepID=UPI0007458279|nr:dynamin-like GTPase family protein [Picosynechococcus sp. PCC 73109]AMA07893.1 dynamin family protein [Picosynechococcus sp. PCC 73109]
MSELIPACQSLTTNVNALLDLWQQEPTLHFQQDTTAIATSLEKATSPKFEIVFAGAFSAGKSMLINALLERELLYSAEGHATGTQCYIEYAAPDQERVVLTFLSTEEIQGQLYQLCQRLALKIETLDDQQQLVVLQDNCQQILQEEGGENKSDKAKTAKALFLLLEGYLHNQERIHPSQNSTYSMEQFNFANLTEAANFARRGSNSAVLKKLQYYCHHPLLEDGNVLVDMPGIDAPVKRDAQLTYDKIIHPDTSAVICVLKPASEGDMTSEETELLEKMRTNLGIRDRVFYVFNRIDQTWYNTQLRQRLDSLIQSQFQRDERIYKTSGLLGFFGSQVKDSASGDRFGIDSIFADSVKNLGGEEETPQFVSEFNNYCANSGKLTRTPFKVYVNSYETPNENYVRILSEWGRPLIEQLVKDSGIEEFRQGITCYLKEEKRPQLFAALADDLQPLCIALRKHLLSEYRELESQPHEIEAMKAQELTRLNQELQEVGIQFQKHITEEINNIIINQDFSFEEDFQALKAKMVSRLDELLQTFSVKNAYSQATFSHPRNATAPLIAILVEALYYLANELEDVLIEFSDILIHNFCQRLVKRIQQSDYYRKLYRLLGNDGGLEQSISTLEGQLIYALQSEARTECDRYVRESPRFYDEGTFSIYQFRQTLQQTSQAYDCESMVEAEPAIRQLLKLDFEPKVNATIRQNFRQTINQTLKTQLLPMAAQQSEFILEQYNVARRYLEQTLEQEAREKIARNFQLQREYKHKIEAYNQAATIINQCLQEMQVYERQLPSILESDLNISQGIINKNLDNE